MYKSKIKTGVVGLRKSIKGYQKIDLATASQDELKILYDLRHDFITKTKEDGIQIKQKN